MKMQVPVSIPSIHERISLVHVYSCHTYHVMAVYNLGFRPVAAGGSMSRRGAQHDPYIGECMMEYMRSIV